VSTIVALPRVLAACAVLAAIGSLPIAAAASSPPAAVEKPDEPTRVRSHDGGQEAAGVAALGEPEWLHIGPLRIRDLTAFGIQRLDFLPAHAWNPVPGTWSFEVNLSYQNTFTLSDNVADYLEEKGQGRRVAVTPDDAQYLFAQDDEAYLLDGELGLFDLVAHYQGPGHWSGYMTIPVLSYADGIFDEFIESFHDQFGFDTQHRELVKQDDLTVLSRLGMRRLALFDPPDDGVGDPVFALSYALFEQPRRWNLIGEVAVKVGFRDHDFFHSSGRNDYGAQLSFQRFYRRQALYLSVSEIYFSGFERTAINPPPVVRKWIASAVAGYEFKIRGRVNGILQLHASPSTVQGTTIDELTEDKFQLSGGVQGHRDGWIYRLAVTENLSNFKNTPDIGATVSITRMVVGRRPRR
jgi:hypothetical protein